MSKKKENKGIKQKNTKPKKSPKVWVPIIMAIVSFVIGIIIDYFEVLEKLGISINRINIEAQGIFISVIVAFLVFSITYLYVDKRNIEREKNQRDIAIILLCQTYERMLEWIIFCEGGALKDIFDNPQNTEEQRKEVINTLSKAPFIGNDIIMNYVSEGIIDAQRSERYINIMSQYTTAMTKASVAYVRDELLNKVFIGLKRCINDEMVCLKKE